MKHNARSQAAMRDYLSGQFTFRQLAQRYNVTQPTVSYWRRKAGLPAPRRGRPRLATPTARQKRVLRLATRYPLKEVGRRLGVSHQRIGAIRKRWQNWNGHSFERLEPGDSGRRVQPKKETRDYVMSFRLTGAELMAVQGLSKAFNRSPNETARSLLLDALRQCENGHVEPPDQTTKNRWHSAGE